ncbi:MAG: PKD domain-containing protein [Bacteroidetes bacterium]|nr:PKD domain-containing protein [Bacteroidota bacterium]
MKQLALQPEQSRINRYRIRLRLVLILSAFLILVQFVHSQQFPFTLNFEEGQLTGWTINNKDTNNAFYNQPTLGDNPTARHKGEPSNHQGNYWIGTYEKYQGLGNQKPGDIQGDVPQGQLTSPYFTIPAGTLSFLVGGGSSIDTRVELRILDHPEQHEDGRAIYASGKDIETMQRVTWDLTPYAGKTGRIRIVDNSSTGWGHINVDDFIFTQPEPAQNDTPDVVPPAGYKVNLSSDPPQTEPGKTVIWTATLEPANEKTEYRFVFGDGQVREWSQENIADHIYSQPGSYSAYVEVRLNQRIRPLTHYIDQGPIATSESVLISVISPPSTGWRWWLLIIVPVAIAGSYFLFRKKKPGKTAIEPPMEIQIIPHAEPGDQKIETAGKHQKDHEVRFRPVSDRDDQTITSESSLIKNERREPSNE